MALLLILQLVMHNRKNFEQPLSTAFHAAEGDPTNLKLCPRGEWQDRLLVETVRAMLTLVCHLKKVMHRG